MKSFNKYLQERKYADREKEAKLSGGKSSVKINPDSESLKEADIKPPAEKLKTDRNMFSIPADEREAAKQRLLAKAKARREAMQTEEVEIEEGMSMKDFKANRRKLKRREASADAEKRGHVGKEWYNSGTKYSPDEAKSGRANMSDYNRQQKYQTAEDPDSDNADTYPASKTKNPKKLRKQKAMGEGYLSEKSLSRAQQRFMGMVYAAKKGETPTSPEVAKAASGMSKKSAKDFAGTKHKGLPEKKVSKEEFEQLDERRKEDKAAGTPRKPRDRAFEYVAKMMGSNRLGVQPRGKKKEPGKKPPKAGEYGGPVSPAQKVAKRRAAAQRAQDNMSSRYD